MTVGHAQPPVPPVPPIPAAQSGARDGAAGRAGGRATVAVGAVIALALLSPLAILAVDADRSGWSEVGRVLFRSLSYALLRNTVELTVLVVLAATVVGSAAAWWTERTALPARRVWTVLLVLPVAMPDFVTGYAWHTIEPTGAGLPMSTLVMALGTYPLVYLPVAAALRRSDPAMEETARSMGVRGPAVFLRVTVPLVRTALLGGGVLVALTVLSEYGAFEILRFQTFTTEIFTEFQFDPDAAGALSIPLVLLGLLLLGIDAAVPRRAVARAAARRAPSRSGSRGAVAGRLVGLTCLVGLGVGVPVGTLGYWMAQSHETTLPAAATLGQATWNTLDFSAWGAAVSVLLALPVAMMTFRRTSATRTTVERATYVTQALPGVVIALSLVFFTTRYLFSLYQTGTLLVAAYAIMHFPLALVCVKASVAQAPPSLADVGRSLGRGPVAVFVRVTLPLIAPGLAAGFCLVFLTAVTELTATLVLAPIGVETLATQFWAFQSEVAYGAAAPYALVIVALAAVPGALLGLWFDREQGGRKRGRLRRRGPSPSSGAVSAAAAEQGS
ncbi:MAG TPA: iron ABC transporter permease [Actinocrinis sp.]|jgi:iron(III) transport system permease protein